MKRFITIVAISILLSQCAISQTDLVTVAEQSEYTSTSTYEDVLSFITELENRNADYVKIETIAQSTEGYDIPMMIVANPLPENPQEVGDRIVIYIQANIHAGEVEGKEAVMMLTRDLLENPDSKILKEAVILITPILNIDGNEKISTNNRRNQVGPVNGVGVRYNGQNLDLNRDAMKLETPEIIAVVGEILNKWDPAISVDCHTTNGSFHEEPITFTWMQNPNGDRSLINYMRDRMMPSVHRTLWDIHDVKNIYYGVFIDRMDYSKGWVSYASEPRYLVNYIGVRNRLAILNENYAYADYKSRVLGCYSFLHTVLQYGTENKNEIQELLSEADKRTINRGRMISVADSFAIDYKGKPTPEPITILAYETDTIPGVVGYWRYKKSDRKVTVTVPYIADYYPTRNVKFPYAYLITTMDNSIISLIEKHGIRVDKLADSVTLSVEEFVFDKITPSSRLNQGHYRNSIEGSFITKERKFDKGVYVIRTNQKLGSLISALLEPEAKDGMLKWNFFDRYLVPQWGSRYYPYPVYKLIDNTKLELVSKD